MSPTLHEAFAAAGYRADPCPSSKLYAKRIIRLSDGAHVGDMTAHEGWLFLADLVCTQDGTGCRGDEGGPCYRCRYNFEEEARYYGAQYRAAAPCVACGARGCPSPDCADAALRDAGRGHMVAP